MAGARPLSSTLLGAYCARAAWRRRTWGRRRRAGKGRAGPAVRTEESLCWQFCKPERGSQPLSSCHYKAKTKETNNQIHPTLCKTDLFKCTPGKLFIYTRETQIHYCCGEFQFRSLYGGKIKLPIQPPNLPQERLSSTSGILVGT